MRAHKLCEAGKRKPVNLWSKRLRGSAAQLVRAHKLCEEERRQPVNLWSKTPERRRRTACAGTQVVRGERRQPVNLRSKTPKRATPYNLSGFASCARRRDVSPSTCVIELVKLYKLKEEASISLSTCDRNRLRGGAFQLVRLHKFVEAAKKMRREQNQKGTKDKKKSLPGVSHRNVRSRGRDAFAECGN